MEGMQPSYLAALSWDLYIFFSYQFIESAADYEGLCSQRLCGQLRLFLSQERQLDCVLGAWHQWVYIQSSYPPPPTFFPLPCLWVTSMHHFRGRRRREKANKQALFPEFIFSKGTRWGGSRHGGADLGEGVLRPAIENCCPYPERSVYTTCKVKQIDPGCRFTCAAACKPPSLSSSIIEHCCWFLSLSLSFPLLFSPSLHTCVCVKWCLCLHVCVCAYIPHVDGRPGSRKALRKISGWHGALSETGLRLVDILPLFIFILKYFNTHTHNTHLMHMCYSFVNDNTIL